MDPDPSIMMPRPPLLAPSPLAQWRIRWTWRYWQWTGWKIEGPFPQWRERSVLLLGPGLDADSTALDFVRLRMGFRVQWLDPSGAPPPLGCLIVDHNEANGHLEDALDFAQRHSVPCHLVQLDRRHRRIRCNTPIRVGPFSDRAAAYVRRIFSYSHVKPT